MKSEARKRLGTKKIETSRDGNNTKTVASAVIESGREVSK